MRYEMMFPDQVRRAIDDHWPVALPLGVLEYHGEHLALGMDTLAVIKTLELLEKEMELVILPPIYYGAASYAVEPPERNGTLHVDSGQLIPFAKGVFASLLKVGFRNVHCFIHHQTENFSAGMPTDLAFRTASKDAIFEYLQQHRGNGWWGDNAMQDYYARHESGTSPFDWICVHPLMDERTRQEYSFDHAGIGETSLMMSLCPEGVDMRKASDKKWYSQTARNASKQYGDTAKDRILSHLRQVLKGKT